VVVFVGPCPVRFLLVSLLDGEAHIWLGDLRFALCGLGLLFLLCCDLPTYMSTGVHVDVILTCFFSCKDRASERYRPHQREKKMKAGFCCTRAPREEQGAALDSASSTRCSAAKSMASAGYIALLQAASNQARDRQGQSNKFSVRNLPKRTIWEDGCT